MTYDNHKFSDLTERIPVDSTPWSLPADELVSDQSGGSPLYDVPDPFTAVLEPELDGIGLDPLTPPPGPEWEAYPGEPELEFGPDGHGEPTPSWDAPLDLGVSDLD